MIVDTHCHYNLDPLLKDWRHHWRKAQSVGVSASLIASVDLDSSKTAIKQAQENSRLVAAVGFHPNYFQTAKQLKEITALKSLIANKRVVAIGEIGLDYFRLSDSPADRKIKSLQQQALSLQLQISAEYHLPVCLHVRDKNTQAYFDVLDILSSIDRGHDPIILHCISGPTKYIQKAIKLGAYLGVAANSTYPNNTQIRDIIDLAPADRILLETDAPFLPPQSYRGQICEPWMIKETATFLLSQKNISQTQMINNTRSAFLDKIPL